MRCDDRAFGLASAYCRSQGRIAQMMPAESRAATTRATIEGSNWGTAILSHAADYSGTSIGAAPWAAFSALKIQTRPPNAPTRKVTAPYNSEMFTPSLGNSPAYPNASPMVASRTPQPAIEIGSMVISMTGGTSWKI